MVWIRTSILRRHNTVAQFIVTRPILDLCEKATRRPGARVSQRWLEQTGIDWKGAQERAEAVVAEPGTDSKSEYAMDGDVGGTGEEASLGASGSSGAGQRMTKTLTFIGQGATAGTKRSNYKINRDRV